MPRLAVLATLAAVLLSGCGTRADDAEIAAGAGGGPVAIPDSVLEELRANLPAATGAPAPGGVTVPDGGSGTAGTATRGGAPADPGSAGTAGTAGAAGTGDAGSPGTPTRAQPGAPAATGAACTTKGAPVSIGQVGTYSGVTGSISAAARTALAVWVQDINARGGLACHPVTLYNRDDGGDPSRAAALVQELVTQRKIVALVANSVAFSASGFRSAVEAAKIPAIGGDLIAPDWHASPWMFPQGASVGDQVIGFVKHGVEAGKKKLALVYCVEVGACTFANDVLKNGGAKQAGADIVYSSAISITQTDFTAQCQNAKNAGADQLALGMDGSAMIRLARSCAALGYKPLLSGLGGTISPGQATDTLLRSFNLATASGPAPWLVEDTPGLKAYHTALRRYAPDLAPDGASVSAWTSATLLERVVANAGEAARTGPLTTALVVTGLGKIKNDTLGGLTGPLTFKPGQAKAASSGCLFFELLTPNGWTAPRGSKQVCV